MRCGAQIVELIPGRREQEIALVAGGIGGPVQLRAVRPRDAPDIMAGGEAVGAEIAGEAHQVGELHPLVAADAGDRRAPARIFVGEALDHALAEPALIIEHIMGDAQPIGPILLGAAKPVHILTPSVTARGVVNISAVATVDAQVAAGNPA